MRIVLPVPCRITGRSFGDCPPTVGRLLISLPHHNDQVRLAHRHRRSQPSPFHPRLLPILSRRSIPARVIHWNCRIWVDHHEARLRIQHNLRQRALLLCPNQPCSPRPSRQDHHRRPRNRVHSLRHIHLPSRSVPEPTPTTSCHPFPLLQKLLELTKEIGRLLREKQDRLENQSSNPQPAPK